MAKTKHMAWRSIQALSGLDVPQRGIAPPEKSRRRCGFYPCSSVPQPRDPWLKKAFSSPVGSCVFVSIPPSPWLRRGKPRLKGFC